MPCVLSIKYNIMREMLNKVTFLTNICFMALNNAAFIIQWVILFHLKKDIGGYTMKEVMLLWGLAASTFGLACILFDRAFSLLRKVPLLTIPQIILFFRKSTHPRFCF